MTEIAKTADANTGTDPPVNIRGALYAGTQDDDSVYTYGGTVSWVNETFPGFQWPTAPAYTLWSYGISSNAWDQYDISLDAPYRPAGGSYAEATDQGLGFYLNGYIDNGSSSLYSSLTNFQRYLDGLIVLDISTQEAVNISTSSLTNYPRAMGGLVSLPNIGSKGIMVSMGGVTKSADNSNLSDNGTYVSFDSVDFFDIASINTTNSSVNWYTQSTTGDIPAPRTDFCVIAASAPDNSSHNIYLYGGKNSTTVYDQMYVLSIPSFEWVKIYEGSSPRYGHTCHLVAQSQMLTVGGVEYMDVTENCDWEDRGVAIMNLRDSTWGSVYNANPGEYLVPSKVYSVIGGSAIGNATMSKPSRGFSNDAVEAFFDHKATASTNASTSTTTNTTTATNTTKSKNVSSSSLSGGDIAGIVIGSLAGVILIAMGERSLLGSLFGNPRQKMQELPDQLAPEMPDSARYEMPDSARYEVPDSAKYEMPDSAKYEVPDSAKYEVPDSAKYEMSADVAPVELPGSGENRRSVYLPEKF
ncbi:cell wall anchored protein [Penicillium malachiteum]|uniref:cell wall anchored protein n=1 Tax=Penicillium malachiteum TaxID=1324776 RepID=UPI0025475F0F|nr:cell wall anchored protein [Penicillium malachiteum]KAJ5730757.1 cell wall anchored protein [Penicillium malachiteum]